MSDKSCDGAFGKQLKLVKVDILKQKQSGFFSAFDAAKPVIFAQGDCSV